MIKNTSTPWCPSLRKENHLTTKTRAFRALSLDKRQHCGGYVYKKYQQRCIASQPVYRLVFDVTQ